MSTPTPPPPANPRVHSVDAFRGFVMLLMMDSALRIPELAKNYPDDPVWQQLAIHTQHVTWTGCSLHDLIQPAFSFLVGVSLPFSIASREERDEGFVQMLLHAVLRGVVLVGLGIFLRSVGRTMTNWTFMDTLTQIGLGYVFLFLVGYLRSQIFCVIVIATILAGYWAAFARHPLPPADFDYVAVGVPSHAPGRFEGKMAHWNKNANFASEFDRWFLNQFPREKEFTHDRSGYTTLNFIPTLATMLFGLLAGMWLREEWGPTTKLTLFLMAGAAFLAMGEASERLGICPVVKIIWTPAWTLYSAGWSFIMLAAFYLVVDAIGFWHLTYPLIVIGANSIVAYCAYHLLGPFILESYQTHLGANVFNYFDGYEGIKWAPHVEGAAVILTIWLVLFWLYRSKLFVRI